MEQWMSFGYRSDQEENCGKGCGRQAYGARDFHAESRGVEKSAFADVPETAWPEKAKGSFAETIAQKRQTSLGEMTLEEYKMHFQKKLDALYQHPSQKNVFFFLDITDAAYQRMQADPDYEKSVLDYLEKQKAVNYGNHPPRFSYVHIDDSWEKCYGYTLGVRRDERYERAAEARRREAKARAKKARKKKLLKEYLERRARQERLLDKLLEEQLEKKRRERIRLEKMWTRKRQANQAARAYEASQIMLSRREQPL